MRGTVGAETLVRGYQAQTSPGYRPIIALGYGLVVGLKGTGSPEMPPQLRSHMLEEAARGGVKTLHTLPSVEAVVRTLRDLAEPGDVVLVKGSRSARMERVLEGFQTP